jgi:geranylgeranyl diphosphate synthase type II
LAPATARAARAHAFVDPWLERVLPPRETSPRRLHAAMHEAVWSGGAGRAPSLLSRLVAGNEGAGESELGGRFAAALALVQCAGAAQADGRGTAILAGDALLTLAFETLARAPAADAGVAMRLMSLLAAATGSAHGIIGAEAEGRPTAALFRAAAMGGAVLAGIEGDLEHWARLGERAGQAVPPGGVLDLAAVERLDLI